MLLPQLLMGIKVTNRHIVATNTVHTSMAAGFGKPVLGGTFYTYARNRTNLHKNAMLLTQLSQAAKIPPQKSAFCR